MSKIWVQRVAMGLFVLLLFALAWAQVWLGYVRVNMAQQRYILERQIALETKKINKLSLEYANLTRPERLRKLAHEQLGMQAPRPDQLIQP